MGQRISLFFILQTKRVSTRISERWKGWHLIIPIGPVISGVQIILNKREIENNSEKSGLLHKIKKHLLDWFSCQEPTLLITHDLSALNSIFIFYFKNPLLLDCKVQRKKSAEFFRTQDPKSYRSKKTENLLSETRKRRERRVEMKEKQREEKCPLFHAFLNLFPD